MNKKKNRLLGTKTNLRGGFSSKTAHPILFISDIYTFNNKNRLSSVARDALFRKIHGLPPSVMFELGAYSTPYTPPVMFERENADKLTNYPRLAIAQALLDDLSACPAGLAFRGFLPHEDFDWTRFYDKTDYARYLQLKEKLDKTEREYDEQFTLEEKFDRIKPKYWRCPESPTLFPDNNIEYTAYETSSVNRNDRKVYFIYGFLDLESYHAKQNYVSYIKVTRQKTKIIDIVDVTMIKEGKDGFILLNTPFLFKAGDNIRLSFGLNEYAKGNYSKIMPVGFIVEPVGCTVTG